MLGDKVLSNNKKWSETTFVILILGEPGCWVCCCHSTWFFSSVWHTYVRTNVYVVGMFLQPNISILGYPFPSLSSYVRTYTYTHICTYTYLSTCMYICAYTSYYYYAVCPIWWWGWMVVMGQKMSKFTWDLHADKWA